LETRRRRGELVAESIIFHIDSDKVIQSWRWEAENTRDLLCMEKVRSLVPVNPHAPEVVAKKVVERIAREKAQAIRYPISFIGDIVVVCLRLSPKFADSLCTPLICTGPNTERDAVQGMLRILLQDERMVQALWLASASDELDVMWKASLANV
jgi:hypothetical protein